MCEPLEFLELVQKNEHPNDDERNCRRSLDPNQWKIIPDNAPNHYSDGRDGG
jgi:hypothetical protein